MNSIIEQAKQTFKTWGIEWAICGGMAIDIFLGEETRKHYDLDLFVFWSDKRKIVELMLKDDWRVFEACGNGVVQELLIAAEATENHRNLFCFKRDEPRVSLECISERKYRFQFEEREQTEFTYIEFLFNTKDKDYFYYVDQSNIKRELSKTIIHQNETPYLSPEVVLLYKSNYVDDRSVGKHDNDFNNTVLHIDMGQKKWLRESIHRLHNGNHKWLMHL